jgi:AraC-like DNA-binding protein
MQSMNAKFLNIGLNRLNRTRQPWGIRAHEHPFHEMICILGGSQHVAISGREIVAHEGDILFYPRGVVHDERCTGRQPLDSFFINFEWDGYSKNIPLCISDTGGRIRILAEWLNQETSSQTSMTLPLIQSVFETLLHQYLVLCFHKTDGFIETMRLFIREHISEPLTLDLLARHSKMSKYYFIRKYRTATGRTPMEDVREMRVAYARQLILATSMPLKLIAPKAGLANVYHMSHLFHRHLGTSPGRLRRCVRRKKQMTARTV